MTEQRLAELRKMARTQAYLVRSEVAELFDYLDAVTRDRDELKKELDRTLTRSKSR